MAQIYYSDAEIKSGSAAAQLAKEKLNNQSVSAPQISWSETMNKNLGIVNGAVTTPTFTPPKPDVVNPEYGVQPPTFSPIQTPAPTPAPIQTPAPVYDYKTDPTFLAWKDDYDKQNTGNLTTAQNLAKDWETKYGSVKSERDTLNANLTTAQADLNKYKPYEDKYNQTISQLTATQANYDDANNRLSALQKAGVKSIDSNQNQSSTVNAAPANMQSYNDNRNASNDQWWSKYLGTGRR